MKKNAQPEKKVEDKDVDEFEKCRDTLKNAQPEKKVEDKDVDEFEKCRDTLKNSTASSSQVVSKNLKASQKRAGDANKEKRQDSLSEKDLDKMEDIKCTHKDTTKE